MPNRVSRPADNLTFTTAVKLRGLGTDNLTSNKPLRSHFIEVENTRFESRSVCGKVTCSNPGQVKFESFSTAWSDEWSVKFKAGGKNSTSDSAKVKGQPLQSPNCSIVVNLEYTYDDALPKTPAKVMLCVLVRTR
jgi:hypothetical protein